MKLKKYIKLLNKLVEKYPEALELKVIYSADEEGNTFKKVNLPPSVGILEEGEYDPEGKPNAVCLN